MRRTGVAPGAQQIVRTVGRAGGRGTRQTGIDRLSGSPAEPRRALRGGLDMGLQHRLHADGRSTPRSAAMIAAMRAGQPAQASRSWRARRNTSATARRPVDQLAPSASAAAVCVPAPSAPRWRCAPASTSCRQPPPVGRPCSLSVSLTAPMAASGTGRIAEARRPRCFAGSVACARRASEAAASIEPSGCSTSRPDTRAFCTAPREMPGVARVLALAHALPLRGHRMIRIQSKKP